MGKQITAAAIRSQRLTTSVDREKTRCLERLKPRLLEPFWGRGFDPSSKDWRSRQAAARKPTWKWPGSTSCIEGHMELSLKP